MKFDKKISDGWNKGVAKDYFKQLTRLGDREFDYPVDRLLSQSLHIFGCVEGAFRCANMMLSCFLGKSDRTNDEVILLLKEYHFDRRLIAVLEEIKDAAFDRSMNRTPTIWVNSTMNVLAAEVILHWSAKTLIRAMDEGFLDDINRVLSNDEDYKVSRKVEGRSQVLQDDELFYLLNSVPDPSNPPLRKDVLELIHEMANFADDPNKASSLECRRKITEVEEAQKPDRILKYFLEACYQATIRAYRGASDDISKAIERYIRERK